MTSGEGSTPSCSVVPLEWFWSSQHWNLNSKRATMAGLQASSSRFLAMRQNTAHLRNLPSTICQRFPTCSPTSILNLPLPYTYLTKSAYSPSIFHKNRHLRVRGRLIIPTETQLNCSQSLASDPMIAQVRFDRADIYTCILAQGSNRLGTVFGWYLSTANCMA